MTSRLFPLPQIDSTTDEYYTPTWIFDRLALTFDLDVCAPPGGVEWVPARRSLSIVDDGLTAPWAGRLWMNPPYSNPTPWVDRFMQHANGVALIPCTSGAWFTRLWNDAPAIAILPRLVFVGGGRFGNPYRIMAAAYGDDCIAALERLGGRVR